MNPSKYRPGIEMNHSHIHLPFFCDQGGDIADNPRFIDSCHFYHCQKDINLWLTHLIGTILSPKLAIKRIASGQERFVNRNLRTCNT